MNIGRSKMNPIMTRRMIVFVPMVLAAMSRFSTPGPNTTRYSQRKMVMAGMAALARKMSIMIPP